MAQGVGEVGGAGGAGGSAKAGGASGFYVADGGEVRYWPVVVGRPVMYIFFMPAWMPMSFRISKHDTGLFSFKSFSGFTGSQTAIGP